MKPNREVVDDLIALETMLRRAHIVARRLRIDHTLTPYVNDRIDTVMEMISKAASQAALAKASVTKARRYR